MPSCSLYFATVLLAMWYSSFPNNSESFGGPPASELFSWAKRDNERRVTKINIVNKQSRTKLARGKKVKVSGFKKAIITLKKGQSIDLTTGI